MNTICKMGDNTFNNLCGRYVKSLVNADILNPNKGKHPKNPHILWFALFWTRLSSTLSSACPQGTFKSFQGAGLCQQCPPNSRSTIEAATLCNCRNGYYRGDMDRPEDMCTSESHHDTNRHTTHLSEAHLSVIIRPLKVMEMHLHIFVYYKHISSWCHQKSNISSLNYRPISALIYYSNHNFMPHIRIELAAKLLSLFWGLGSSK